MGKIIEARYRSVCAGCGKRVRVRERVDWTRGGPVYHLTCRPSASADPVYSRMDADDRAMADAEMAADRAQTARENAEYERGVAEGQRYIDDVKTYGRELAEQWEMEAELARWNRGED